MALCGCTNGGLFLTALVTLLLVPAQYYIPEFSFGTDELALHVPNRPLSKPFPPTAQYWLLSKLPLVDLIIAVTWFLLVIMTYFCDWIQRKLLERRLTQLKQNIRDCVDRLRALDSRQEQLEATLKMVQNATSEYNLLLYLLLRYRRLRPAPRRPDPCFFDKELRDFSLLADDAPDASLM